MTELKRLLTRDEPTKETKIFCKRYRLPGHRTVLKNLQSIAERVSPFCESEPFLLKLLDKIKESAYPEQALNQTERFFQQLEDPARTLEVLQQNKPFLQILTTIFGASPYLSSILVQNPALFLWLINDRVWNAPLKKEALVQEILESCHGISNPQEAYPVQRLVKRREILRIGAKDLTGFADLIETTDALTTLAEASLEAAYQLIHGLMKRQHGTPQVEDENGRQTDCRFVILGMGKLGGEELNFSSDIDILYLYESDRGETTGISNATGGVQGKIANHLYYTRLSEGITDMVHANTEDGFVFRVDLRLRPEGSQGPVASSLRSYELYYESFGQTWERAALLKCRPVAGDVSLGSEFETMLQPFIYRKYLDYSAIDEIKGMKTKILQGLVQKASQRDNIKLGRGGIREIEFFIQALQLIYGGRTKWIRGKNSLRALHRLCDKQLITYEDYSTLSKAYTFLRDVEHKLQIENQLQLQTLPKDRSKLEQLSRRCSAPSLEVFLEELSEYREKVQELFENLFYEKEEAKIQEDSPVYAILHGQEEMEKVYTQLLNLGFQEPRRAYKNLELLKEGSPYAHTSSRSKAHFWKIAPQLLEVIAASPDPDMALNHLERFVSVYGARRVFYELLEENPPLLRRVVSLFSMSSYLSNLLIRHPEAIEVLFVEDQKDTLSTSREITHALMEGTKKVSKGTARIEYLRHFKNIEEMKIGLHHILTESDILETSTSLSRLADACLETAYQWALEELSRSYGTPKSDAGEDARFAILAAGKLGSEELTYGSDLDLLFVYTEDGETSGPEKISNSDFFTRLAGRIVTLLSTMTAEGAVYQVDLRLRPLGEGGPLVTSLEGYRKYFQRNLQTWERQALTRIRFCGGDQDAGEALLFLIQEALYGAPAHPNLKVEIFEMRMRIEKEKTRPTEGLLFFKTGAGGLVGIEFMVQYLKLCYGYEHTEIRSAGALQALEWAGRRGILSQEEAQTLKEAYLFLRRLESRTRIVQDRAINALSSDPKNNRALALRMGYEEKEGSVPGEHLLQDYREVTQKTCDLFLRLMG